MNTNSSHTDCPICCGTVQNSVGLSCCNTRFCMKCLDGWRPDLADYVNGNRTCPWCRALVPPTRLILSQVGFYKTVSLSLRILMQDVPNLPSTPFFNVEHMDQVAIRRRYKAMETNYGLPVHLFEQKYGFEPQNIIPSSPPTPIYLPINIAEAVRAENYGEVRMHLGSLPIPPERLNSISQENGDTLLHIAVHENQNEMVKVMLALGAEVNVANADSLNPLQCAVRLYGNDNDIVKTLIRWGAKKVPMVPCGSSASPMVDSMLAAVATAVEKKHPSRKLKDEDVGRHCKFQVGDVTKRGTIVKQFAAHYVILLDDTKEYKIETKRTVEICKPLLFDFRDIDLDALFPSPPPLQINIPQEHHGHSPPQARIESTFNNVRNASGDHPLAEFINTVDPTSMTSQAIDGLLQRAVETIQAMETSQRMAREVLRIHQEMAQVDGSESSSSIHSHAYLRRTQESVAAQDHDILTLRNATAMLRQRAIASGNLPQVQQASVEGDHSA